MKERKIRSLDHSGAKPGFCPYGGGGVNTHTLIYERGEFCHPKIKGKS